jgi:chloride channel protein, CIC family
MLARFRERLARVRSLALRDESPRLSDESRWYTEHTALLISTLKWALLGTAAGVCVGLGTRVFLSALERSAGWARGLTHGRFPAFVFLPVALPLCVWLIRTFSPDARGHGTEAVIAAVHQRSGRVDWLVAPVKLAATVVTLAFGGSVGKEGPAAQIGAALTSLFADMLRLRDEDRRRLVICGISAGFAAVFGTPVSGALFGIEVLYLGRIDYTVIFPALVAGIVAHLTCGVPPFPALQAAFTDTRQVKTILIMLACGALFGLIALLLIESLRLFERTLRRFERRPYLLAASGAWHWCSCIWQLATRTPVSGLTRSTACWRARHPSWPGDFSSRFWRRRSRLKRAVAVAS